ncbi:MAG: adenosine-specific kinase [Candidatus Krumholzibacteria bacterium]|nr:adenosine-specific kinase [Candidatus Krumholzibacteria bacterium]
MEIKSVRIKKPAEVNFILGQSHFIKTVEDLHETAMASVPGIKFGLAFCEASGACLIRCSGNDPAMIDLARDNAQAIAAGHTFIMFMRDAYPVNILNAVKAVSEVCNIFCATANEVEVIVAESEQGRGILGVIDGERPKGVEQEKDRAWRHDLLRKFGYKL